MFLFNSCKTSADSALQAVCRDLEVKDLRLAKVWLDFQELATGLNLAYQTQRKLSPDIFQEALISIQYRLQHLSYDAQGPHELLRLAMLALSTTIFHETVGVKLHLHYRPLAERFRTALQSSLEATHTKWKTFALWLVYIGAISVLDATVDYRWLKGQVVENSVSLNLRTWAETRQALKAFIWIDVVNDKVGERFFEQKLYDTLAV